MPTIFARWILGICLRLGNNLSKMCSFAEFNRSPLAICTNLQKKHCIGEQLFLGEWSFQIISTISVRWILGICHRFGNNLSKMCSFVELNQSKLDICTNLQTKHCIGEKILLMVLELLNIAHHIRQTDFSDLTQIWK